MEYEKNKSKKVCTVKNSGIHPSDVTETETDREALTQGQTVNMIVKKTDSGYEATEIVIFHFIH